MRSKHDKIIKKAKDIQARIHFNCFKEGFKRKDDEYILEMLINSFLTRITQKELEKVIDTHKNKPFNAMKDTKNLAKTIKEIIDEKI
jgi:hypothetical protein